MSLLSLNILFTNELLKLGSVLLWPITARSTLQDGLYRYDAIARLQDVQIKQTESTEKQQKEKKVGLYHKKPDKSQKSLEIPFKVPDAPSLREQLDLARALRPLMRRIPSGSTLVLDEAATTQRIADEGIWIPILRPTLEPWLDLELVVD